MAECFLLIGTICESARVERATFSTYAGHAVRTGGFRVKLLYQLSYDSH